MTDEVKTNNSQGRGKKQLMEQSITEVDPHNPINTFKMMGFDPIVASIQLLKEIDKTIKEIKRNPKPSWPAISTLFGVKERINTNLTKYAYRIQDPSPDTLDSRIPFAIELTESGEVDIKINGDKKTAKEMGLSKETVNSIADSPALPTRENKVH